MRVERDASGYGGCVKPESKRYQYIAVMGAVKDEPHYARFKHLHNLPLDMIFGFGGPVGLALTLLLDWQGLLAMHRARRTGYVLLPMIACGTLATSLFAGMFLFPISVVAVAIGLSIAIYKSQKA